MTTIHRIYCRPANDVDTSSRHDSPFRYMQYFVNQLSNHDNTTDVAKEISRFLIDGDFLLQSRHLFNMSYQNENQLNHSYRTRTCCGIFYIAHLNCEYTVYADDPQTIDIVWNIKHTNYRYLDAKQHNLVIIYDR